MSNRWTTEEEIILKEIYVNNSKEFILSKINKSWLSIRDKALKLNLRRDPALINADRKIKGPRKDSCSEEEKKLLFEIFEHSPKKIILEKFSRFDRSAPSIFRFAKQLGLKRDPELILQDMIEGGKTAPAREDFWSPAEDQILIDFYPNNLQKDIMEKLPGRTWKAIREQSVSLNLRRNKEMIDKDRDIKSKITLMDKYGVDCSLKIPEAKTKSLQTNMGRRGVPYHTQTQAGRDKIKKTVQQRYGVDNVFQSEEIKEKMAETNIERYGFENPNQSPEIREKSRQTCQNKYGVDNPFQLVDRVRAGMTAKYGADSPLKVPEIQAQQQATNIEKYGFKSPAQNEEVQKKFEETCMTKYGVKTPFQNEQVKQKIAQTNMDRYGVDNPLKLEIIQNKARQTLYEHGTQKCSKQQYHIATLLNGKINHPIGNCNVDILLGDNVICEYDGGGHNLTVKLKGGISEKEFINSERRRDLFLISKGFSIIRIISKDDKIPSDNILVKMIDEAKEYLNKGHSWINFNIDEKKIICREYNRDYDFGSLRKIN